MKKIYLLLNLALISFVSACSNQTPSESPLVNPSSFNEVTVIDETSNLDPSIISEVVAHDSTIDQPTNITIKETVGIHISDGSNVNEMDLTDAVAKVKDTVVDVYSYGTSSVSAGSGIIVGKSLVEQNVYYAITNHHVIANCQSFKIVTYDKNDNSHEFDATLVGGSPKSDIAVLKYKSNTEQNIATFYDDSNDIKLAESVFAIGNPLGVLGGSVTRGIISAKQREVLLDSVGYMNLIQTDAAINSGNSGGALFNSKGLLIGVVNSGYSNYEGLNFAIPCNDARNAFVSICETYNQNDGTLGYVKGETDLGISVSSAQIYSDDTLKSAVNILYVDSIKRGSDAFKAEPEIKDFQTFSSGNASTFYSFYKINEVEVTSETSLIKMLQNLKTGETVKITFKEVAYKRSGSMIFAQNYYYLTEKIVEVSITLSQYIYKIN